MNPKTGMSVDLNQLDVLASRMFKNEKLTDPNLISFLKKKVNLFNKELRKNKTKLTSMQFNECRNIGIHFNKNKVFFVRTDYAEDSKGNLFKVVSYMDEMQNLAQIDLKNFRSQTSEQIIF